MLPEFNNLDASKSASSAPLVLTVGVLMKREAYQRWLESQQYAANTITAQMHRANRVEEFHGDLDEHYAKDRMASLLEGLTYSKNDERNNRPNPSKIPFDGNIRTNIASYRDAIKRYMKFIESGFTTQESPQFPNAICSVDRTGDEQGGQRIGLERDMQAALRKEIHQLEPGIKIIDEGAERSVDSGFIDITARDGDGVAVVIELKAGRAGRDAVGQILSYMGDIVAEEDSGKVRGILVAADFDNKAKAAAKMVPNLVLRKYSVQFTFSDGSV